MIKKMTPNRVDKGLTPCYLIKNLWCSQVVVETQGKPHGSPNGSNMSIDHL